MGHSILLLLSLLEVYFDAYVSRELLGKRCIPSKQVFGCIHTSFKSVSTAETKYKNIFVKGRFQFFDILIHL